MEPTDPQAAVIRALRETYGRTTVKPHAPDPATGIMRVSLTCVAGVWEWFYDADGTHTDHHLTMRLFDPPAPEHKARNAIDN